MQAPSFWKDNAQPKLLPPYDAQHTLGPVLPWREAGPPNHHDDKVDSDMQGSKCTGRWTSTTSGPGASPWSGETRYAILPIMYIYIFVYIYIYIYKSIYSIYYIYICIYILSGSEGGDFWPGSITMVQGDSVYHPRRYDNLKVATTYRAKMQQLTRV